MTDDFARRAAESVEIVRRSLRPTPRPATISDVDILRFAEAIGARPRTGADGRLQAPPLFLPPFPPGDPIGHDGRRRPAGAGSAADALAFRVMGGCSVAFSAPIRSGDQITATSTLETVVEKMGSRGPMLLVTTATAYRDQHGNPKRIERWTIVHRD
ncbi:MAG: MaoC family dehydratase N-terminal domain-containing protein [Actinomycetota bacterium]|nr:MaoC family dehydratase N-terminal domain-containing protein [Actinomycetota bacterium]